MPRGLKDGTQFESCLLKRMQGESELSRFELQASSSRMAAASRSTFGIGVLGLLLMEVGGRYLNSLINSKHQ